MTRLDDVIEELLELEPFWRICYPCRFKGVCCHGAKISVTPDEQAVIDEYLSGQPLLVRRLVFVHKMIGWHCKYHTDEGCLIHDVRPANCRYTPFQMGVSSDHVLTYSMVRVGESGHCEFSMQHIPLSDAQGGYLASSKFPLLDNFGRPTRYLSLNWLAHHHMV